jgi:hypothetical protein
MNAILRNSGAIAAAALLASSCAVRQPLVPGTVESSSQKVELKTPGDVTVPLTIPALTEPGVQYAYDRNTINTIEVRLRDALGNEAVQYVARNAYLSGSQAGGIVKVTFSNVMPGDFTLTVRSSHERLLAATGRISYDGLRDVFFLDGDGDQAFDPGETEPQVIWKSGTTSANSHFVTFAPDHVDASWIFPTAMRTDLSLTRAGFGVGGATGSIVPGGTTQVAVTVGQLPQWDATIRNTVRTVIAGEPVAMMVLSTGLVQPSDMIMIDGGVGITGGVVDAADFIDSSVVAGAKLSLYAPTTDVAAGTVTFTPTYATHPDSASSPTAWPVWLSRGQAVSELGVSAATTPKLIVHPALVNDLLSSIYGQASHVAAGDASPIRYDLRDAFANRVAGNLVGRNSVPLGNVSMANTAITMDYGVYSHSYAEEAQVGMNPFILPGRTTGTVDGAGVFTQGTTPPELMTRAASYSVSQGGIRIKRLEVPYHVYDSDPLKFGPGDHDYRLNFVADPGGDANKRVASLTLVGGPVVATGSVTLDTAARTEPRDILLNQAEPDASAKPVPLKSERGVSVILTLPPGTLDVGAENGTVFTVKDYGARRVTDRDTVRVRVLKNKELHFSKDVVFGWAN